MTSDRARVGRRWRAAGPGSAGFATGSAACWCAGRCRCRRPAPGTDRPGSRHWARHTPAPCRCVRAAHPAAPGAAGRFPDSGIGHRAGPGAAWGAPCTPAPDCARPAGARPSRRSLAIPGFANPLHRAPPGRDTGRRSRLRAAVPAGGPAWHAGSPSWLRPGGRCRDCRPGVRPSPHPARR
ncbi:hypothetical protein D3C79_840520 [compost metagenome]